MKSIVLSRDQEVALTRIGAWMKSKDPFFVLDGPAGSGKTELARMIGDDSTIFCSYTGKAANVLRQRGVNASTVHRALYKPKEKSRAKLQTMIEQLMSMELQLKKAWDRSLELECDRLRSEVRHERRRTASPSWEVPLDAAVKSADLIVVDEYSMLDDRIVGDLRAHAKKVLFLGDPHQLPPVRGTCPLAGKADYALTEVHRQALENPILWALTQIRDGRHPPTETRKNEHGCWEYLNKKRTSWDDHYATADQLIVARNATRATFNKRYRKKLGMDGLVDEGERVIFLRNDHDMEVFNGSTGRVTNSVESDELLELMVEIDGGEETLVDTWAGIFRGADPTDAPRGVQMADYGYAITAHKAQGSEYDHVVVWNETLGGSTDHRRWMYTACSRAKTRCTFVET